MNNVDNIFSFIYIDIFSVCFEGKGNKRIFIFKKKSFYFSTKKVLFSRIDISYCMKSTYIFGKRYISFGEKVPTFW